MNKKGVNKQIFQEAFDLMNSERNSLFLDDLEHKIGEAVLKTKGVELATVVSAVEFSDPEKEKFTGELKKILKREVHVNFRTDPKILGGFRVTMGDWKLDGTLLYQLETMKKALGGT